MRYSATLWEKRLGAWRNVPKRSWQKCYYLGES
jgi:hypothetical protein